MRGGCVLVHQLFMIYLLWMRHQAFPRTLGFFPYLLFIGLSFPPLTPWALPGSLMEPPLGGWTPQTSQAERKGEPQGEMEAGQCGGTAGSDAAL